MSYGKWKALHPHTEVPEHEEPQKMPRKVCQLCGREIPWNYGGSKYCGVECAYQGKLASARRHDQKRKERMMADGKA